MTNIDALNQQLRHLVRSMEEDGLLDIHFGIVHSLKEANSPFFVAELIPMFYGDVQAVIRNLTHTLDQSYVDYRAMEQYCIKLKGGTSCIGACRMTRACAELRQAIDNRSKEGCIIALNGLQLEYYNLRGRLDSILQLERRIVSNDTIRP